MIRNLSKGKRVLAVSSALAAVFLFVYTVLFLTGGTYVQGRFLSGRLFLPLAFVLICGLASFYLPWGDKSLKKATSGEKLLLRTLDKVLFAVSAVLVLFLAAILITLLMDLPDADSSVNVYRYAYWSVLVCTVLVIALNGRLILNKPHLLFCILALASGLIMAVFAPINVHTVWDGEIHFQNAVYLSRFGKLEFTDAEWNMVNDHYSIHFHIPAEKAQISAMHSAQFGAIVEPESLRVPVKSIFQGLAYLPRTGAVLLGRILELPFYHTVILGKLVNLFFYVFLVALAIKITPVGKRIMMVIALLPTNIVLAASYSCDTWITGLTMLWIALLLEEMSHPERKLTFEKLFILLSLFMLSCAAKEIYCILGLLFLMIPREKFAEKKSLYAFGGIVLLCVAAVGINFVLPFLQNTETQSDMRGGSDVNAGEQLRFILANPLAYARILWNYLKGYLSPASASDYTVNLCNLNLGLSTQHLLLSIVLAVTVATDRNKLDLQLVDSCKNRLTAGISLIGAVCLICTAMYISFTPVGLETINGVQGRYLTPLLFPAFLFAGTGRIQNTMSPRIYNLLVGTASFWGLYKTIWECSASLFFFG